MAVGGVEDERVGAGVDERIRAFERVRADADGGSNAEAARVRPSSPIGYSMRFEMSLTVISPRSTPASSTTGNFSILCRWRISSASSSVVPDGRRDQLSARHQLRHRPGRVLVEAEVAVREDADEPAVGVRDRDARDAIALHQLERAGDVWRREGA